MLLVHQSGQFLKCLEKKDELALPGKLCFTSFAFAFCVFKIEISTKLFQRKGFSSNRLGPSKKKQYWGLVCGQKNLPPKTLFHFFFSTLKRHYVFSWQEIPLFCAKNFNFKPHNETCLSLWCGLCRKRCAGEKRTCASTTLREIA